MQSFVHETTDGCGRVMQGDNQRSWGLSHESQKPREASEVEV
jgi:hypothetical protein